MLSCPTFDIKVKQTNEVRGIARVGPENIMFGHGMGKYGLGNHNCNESRSNLGISIWMCERIAMFTSVLSAVSKIVESLDPLTATRSENYIANWKSNILNYSRKILMSIKRTLFCGPSEDVKH